MATTTEVLAAGAGVKGQTIRAAVCRTGSYFGLKPTKLPNGRLLWPDDAIERLKAFAAEPEQQVARQARTEKILAGKSKAA